jgi:hypothetical protein
MAKISTYATTAPALGDMLIGTDVNDMNSTKNFTIGSLLSLPGSTAYVPYTGALYNVDLGANDITAFAFLVPGGLGTDFLKADGSLDNTVYLPVSTAAATYVPYTGATGNVDLGSKRLTAQSLRITTDDAEMRGISCLSSAQDYFEIGNNGWTASGFLVDFVNNRYFLGDWGSAVNSTYIKVDDANSRVEISKAIYTNSSTGTAGQVLTSQGAGLPATWTTPPVLYSATFFHNANQANGGITVANQALLNSTQQASGFTLGPDNRVNVLNTGVYFLSVNLQLVFIGGGSSPYNVTVWFTINDVIVPNSAFTFTTSSAQNDQTLATITDTVVLNAGDYIKVYWWSSVAAISLLATPAGTNPTRPLSPSVNFSIFNIG